jgi:hypothetical protein
VFSIVKNQSVGVGEDGRVKDRTYAEGSIDPDAVHRVAVDLLLEGG